MDTSRSQSPDPIEIKADVYALVTDAQRLVLLQRLQAHGPLTARELAELHGSTSGAVNHHLAALRDAGWVQVVGEVPRRRLAAKVWAVTDGVDWRSTAVAINEILSRRSA